MTSYLLINESIHIIIFLFMLATHFMIFTGAAIYEKDHTTKNVANHIVRYFHALKGREVKKWWGFTVWKNEKFSLNEKRNSSNQLFSNFFSKTIALTKFLEESVTIIS